MPLLAETAMSGIFDRSHEIQRSRKSVPEGDGRTHREMVAVLIGEADLQLRVLPHAHQGQRMFAELLARCRELGTRLGTLKKRASQQVFEAFDARRHGRLRDVHLARGIDETTRLGNHQKGARESDIHRAYTLLRGLVKLIYRNFR